MTPFRAADAGRFDGGLESRSSSDAPGGLGKPEDGGLGGPAPDGPGGVELTLGVELSASEDFCRLMPPSAVSVNPREAVVDRDRPDGGGGSPEPAPGPAERES